MITIDTAGAATMLAAHRRAASGETVSERALSDVLAANAYMIGFYASWPGYDAAGIEQAFAAFLRNGATPSGEVPQRLMLGFRMAARRLDQMERRLAALRDIDLGQVCRRVLELLPADTPLDSTIHVTVDHVNNAFAFRGDMGVSVLKGASSAEAFLEVVSHELHHIGFSYWAARDAARTRILARPSPRAVAVRHIQNLLMEGLANHYLTPAYVYRDHHAPAPTDAFQARLARLEGSEPALFGRAGEILAMCLEDDADLDACEEAYRTVAMDFEDYQLPAGHFLGARMVAILGAAYERAAIVACIRHLDRFLALYNAAAARVGAYVFDPADAERLGAMLRE